MRRRLTNAARRGSLPLTARETAEAKINNQNTSKGDENMRTLKHLPRLFIGAAAGLALSVTGAFAQAESADPVKLAFSDWTTIRLNTEIASRILQKMGYNTEMVPSEYLAQIGAIEEDPAADSCRRDKIVHPVDRAEQGRSAAAGRPDYRCHRMLAEIKRNLFYRVVGAEVDIHIFKRYF